MSSRLPPPAARKLCHPLRFPWRNSSLGATASAGVQHVEVNHACDGHRVCTTWRHSILHLVVEQVQRGARFQHPDGHAEMPPVQRMVQARPAHRQAVISQAASLCSLQCKSATGVAGLACAVSAGAAGRPAPYSSRAKLTSQTPRPGHPASPLLSATAPPPPGHSATPAQPTSASTDTARAAPWAGVTTGSPQKAGLTARRSSVICFMSSTEMKLCRACKA